MSQEIHHVIALVFTQFPSGCIPLFVGICPAAVGDDRDRHSTTKDTIKIPSINININSTQQ